MPAKTFTIDVDGVGTFTFRRRVLRDEFRISAEYTRLTEGVENPPEWLDNFADAVASIKALVVDAPEGWGKGEIDNLDPYDESTYKNIVAVRTALHEKEFFFRAPGKAGSEAQGEGEQP
jgi:hypothetical protein